eukprot:6192501-Pleurochrysis_carterae.AAC.1
MEGGRERECIDGAEILTRALKLEQTRRRRNDENRETDVSSNGSRRGCIEVESSKSRLIDRVAQREQNAR